MRVNSKFGAALLAFAALVFLRPAAGQDPPPPPEQAPLPPPYSAAQTQVLPAQQLDDLVAPIALYPDPLLGEVLAASTYPMEIAEAEQWVRDHPKWHPSKLMDEAKKQPWDPSVQGLVAFPQALAELSQNTGWTTALGNAFLSQQADVMQAVQRMRQQAQARGTLQSGPQANVTQGNGGVVDIEPANPDMLYVPEYNPAYIWGPPVYGAYPELLYPGIDLGFGWGPGIDLGLYFGGWGGWGWGGWGWSPNWYGNTIILNNSFFHRYGFRHFDGRDAFGTSNWAHDPGHRLGVPYANRGVAERFAAGSGRGFNSNFGRGEADRQGFAGRQETQRFGSSGFEERGWTGNHSAFGGYHNGGATRQQSDHGFSSMGAGRVGGFGGGGFHGGGGGGGFHGGGGGRR